MLRTAEQLLAQSHDHHEERGHHDLVDDNRAEHAAEHHDADRLAALATRARRDRKRQDAEDEREARHQDRPQAELRRVHRSVEHGLARVVALGRELRDHDRVLRGEPDEHHEADLRIDIERAASEAKRHKRAEHRERDRQQHVERQRPRLVLRGKQEEHGEKRKPEDERRISARLDLLVGRARPLVGEARGKRGGRHLRHSRDRVARAVSRASVPVHLVG